MALRAERFRHNNRLQFAAENSPALHKGEKGHPVRLLQQALNDVGFPMPDSFAEFGSPDGLYGKETRDTVWSFQKKHHLDKDGAAGRQTLGKLDDLLAFKPYLDLPPITGPGGAKDIDSNSERVIIDVLELMDVQNVSFSLTFEQRERHVSLDDPNPNPVQATHRVLFSGFSYKQVRDRVQEGLITVKAGASHHTAAQYIPNNLVPGFPADTILVGRQLRFNNTNDRSLVVHEATHAACDVQRIGTTNALFSEMIAFVAESYYRKLAGLGPKHHFGNEGVIYRSADSAVSFLRRNEKPPTHLLNEMWEALDRTHPGFINQQVVYNGV